MHGGGCRPAGWGEYPYKTARTCARPGTLVEAGGKGYRHGGVEPALLGARCGHISGDVGQTSPQGAETYARSLGKAWTRSPVWCVIFQVPGDPAGCHVEAGGVEIEHKYIDQQVKESVRRARRENTEKERAMAAMRECAENLRFIHASKRRGVERGLKQREEKLADKEQDSRRTKIIIAAVVAGTLVLLAVIVFLVTWFRSKTFTYEFPDTSWRTRFQAPHSGGSGIVVNYRERT